MKEMLKHGMELFFWACEYLTLAWSYFMISFASSGLPFPKHLYPPLTLGFFLLWFYFGYTARLGFWKGIIIGSVSGIAVIFFIMPLTYFYHDSKLIKFMPLLLAPLLILSCGVGSHFGSLKKN